jgi:hypothetical protein
VILSVGSIGRIRLRDNVKWHDGTPFTADDVKFNLDLINNSKFAAGRRAGHELVKDIKVVSPTEITWRLERPYAPYQSILSWTFLVPKHLLEKEADPNTTPKFLANPVGTGAFKWVDRVPGDHITLAAYPGYHGGGPHLERLTFKYIPDLTVLYTQFQTGEIDYTGIQFITPDHYAEAKTLKDRVVTRVPQPFVENIAVNTGLPVFKDRAVREALYYAIDKQSIIEQIYYGLPAPTESFLPSQSWAFNPNLPKHEYNLLDHRRQPCAGAGTTIAPAKLAGDRRQDEHKQSSPGGHVGRLLDDVEIRERNGRHRLHGRSGSGLHGLLFQPLDRRQGRRRAEHDSIRKRRCRCPAQVGFEHGRYREAQGRLPEDAGDHAARSALPADLPIHRGAGREGQARRVRAERQRAGELLERQYLVLGKLIGMRTCARPTAQVRDPADTRKVVGWQAICSDAAYRASSCSASFR